MGRGEEGNPLLPVCCTGGVPAPSALRMHWAWLRNVMLFIHAAWLPRVELAGKLRRQKDQLHFHAPKMHLCYLPPVVLTLVPASQRLSASSVHSAIAYQSLSVGWSVCTHLNSSRRISLRGGGQCPRGQLVGLNGRV